MVNDISDLLIKHQLDATQMGEIKGLPKQDFIRIFGDHEEITYQTHLPVVGLVEYTFNLVQREPQRKYINTGYKLI